MDARDFKIDYLSASGDNRRRIQIHDVEPDRIRCNTPDGVRTFLFRRVLAVFDQMGESLDRDQWIADLGGDACEVEAVRPVEPNSHYQQLKDNLVVLFTGFNAAEKAELVALAEEYGMIVSKSSSITKTLNFLVMGENAGPAKIQKAIEQGVPMMNREQFDLLLKTGEIEQDANEKGSKDLAAL